MRILVTGAAGFVGHHVVEHLLRLTEHEVVALVSFRHSGCPLRLAHLQEHGRLSICYHDLRAPISERLAVTVGDVDAIWHLAAESHVDRSIEDPVPFFANNAYATLHMLEWARRIQGLRQFLQFSTDEVYGAALTGQAHKEWSPIIPSNPYSASKAAQEAAAIYGWRTYGLPVVILNTMNMVGERQDPEKFIPKLIRCLVAGREVPIHGRAAGDIWHQERPVERVIGSRMYLHCRNLASALVFLVDRPPARYPEAVMPDRWNVAGEREIDNLELAELVAEMVGRPLRYRLVDFQHARPGHDRRYALDSTKIREAGWVQPINLESSLRKTVQWTLAHPEWLA
jgi:dTDP-glucose 4,6-dehydratase